jgi:hypothetical protein
VRWHESIKFWLQCYKQLHEVSWHDSIKQSIRQTSDLLVVHPAYTDETLTLTNIRMTLMLTGLRTYVWNTQYNNIICTHQTQKAKQNNENYM